jgi:predicted molibdopterin-dependent oxidoreductase YjgC
VDWIIAARRSGVLRHLVVQGVVMTDLARAADVVLPGACAFEKQASYTNDQGLVQRTARVNAPPGDAVEDWRILVQVAGALGVPLAFTSADAIRGDIAGALAAHAAYRDLAGTAPAKPAAPMTWLDASNPSERWKWDRHFKDQPPTKSGSDSVETDR